MKIAIKKRTKATTMILIGLITAFGSTSGYASNQFADTPLYLQSKSLKKTGYNAKHNVLFLIDSNLALRDKNVQAKSFEEFHRALELTLGETSNRKNFNFAVYPTTSTCEYPNFTRLRSCSVYKTIHDPDTLTGFNSLMEIIHGNYKPRMDYLYNGLKHVEFRTIPKVLRNILMNKLEYRCQKPFLVFVKFGDYQYREMFHTFRYFPVTDSTLSLQGRDYGYDGYFDGDSVRDDTMFKLGETNSNYNALQYYTNTIRTKSFGNYIYTKDILSTELLSDLQPDDTEYLKSTKHSDRKLYDNAGKPWNEQDPNANLPWHNDKYTQTATTFVAAIGQIPFSKYDTSKDVNQELSLRTGFYPSWKSYYDSKQQLLMNAASPRKNSNTEKNATGRYYYSILNDDNIIGNGDEIQKTLQNILDEIKKIGGNYIEEKKQQNNSFSPVMGTAILDSQRDSTRKSVIIRVQTDSDDWSSKLCWHPETESNNENGNITCDDQHQINNHTDANLIGRGEYVFDWKYYAHSSVRNNTFKIPDNGVNSSRYIDESEYYAGLLSWLNRTKDDNKIRTTLLRPYKVGREKIFWHQLYRIRKSDANAIGDIIHNTIESSHLYLATSANDGMVHVYQYSYDPSRPFKASFTFTPLNLERDSTDGSDLAQHYFKDLTNVSYGKIKEAPHRYLLDGGLTLVTTPRLVHNYGYNALATTRPRQTFLVSNLGRAGRGAFAINVGGSYLTSGHDASPAWIRGDRYLKNTILFQTPIGKDNEFGYTIGSPGVALTRVNRDDNAPTNTYSDHLRETAFINNGVNFPGKEISENESALYIYEILGVDLGINRTNSGRPNSRLFERNGDPAGTLIKKLTATDGKGGLAGTVVYDINNDGIADLIYAGDYGGNLYRFDIRNPHPDKWSVTKIFKADGPITSAPTLFRPDDDDQNSKKNRIIVVFGTGSELYQSDIDNKNQQAIYGIYDEFDETGEKALVQSSDLLEQNMIYKDKKGELSSNKFLPEKHKGWYFKLNNDGERITSKINALLSTGMVISRSYNHEVTENKNTADANDPCLTGPSSESINVISRIMQFDARNGGKLSDTSPHFRLPNIKVDETIQSSYEFDGALGMILTIVSNDYHLYNSLDAGRSGEQKIDPTGAFSKFENCYRGTDINMHLSDGQSIKLENIPHCGIELISLNWREIKDSFQAMPR